MEAYQYKIRVEKSKTEKIDFDEKDLNLKDSIIRIIDKNTAKNIILEYEWLQSMPYIVKYCFGLYFNVNGVEKLGGVLVFSNDYADNTGVWDKYEYTDKLLLLSRGVCLWWTPKNSASYFISRACRWIKNNTKYRIITATVDPAAGEIGIIYQSLNWNYVGVMSGNYYHKNVVKRFAVIIDGKLRSSRWVRNKLGTMKKDVILSHYPDAKFVPQYRKQRYFYFMDTKTQNKKHYKSIEHMIQPYPKKNQNTIGLIYMIKNKTNNKVYIGQTTRSFNDRINDYKRGYYNDYLGNAIKKYGWDNFEFKIIDNAQTIEELNNKEIRYIIQCESNNRKFGYNIQSGGNNVSPTEDTLEKMSKSHLGKKQTDIWVKKRIAISGSDEAKKYGRSKTEHEKKYLSEKSPKYWLGKKRDAETRKKISETKKTKGLSDIQKKIICKPVIKKNLITGELVTYDSTKHASKIIGVNQSTISRWCSKNKTINNEMWSYS